MQNVYTKLVKLEILKRVKCIHSTCTITNSEKKVKWIHSTCKIRTIYSELEQLELNTLKLYNQNF